MIFSIFSLVFSIFVLYVVVSLGYQANALPRWLHNFIFDVVEFIKRKKG